MTLAVKDAHIKLVDIIAVADVIVSRKSLSKGLVTADSLATA